jgi:hypothetical protein
MELLLGFLKPLVQFFDALFELSFGPDISLGPRRPRLGFSRIQLTPCALDQSGHLRRDNGVDASHVLAHGLQFGEGANDVVPVTAKGILGRFAAIDRVPDQNFVMLLAVSIDPAISLLHDVGIVGNLDVDQAIAVVLQIDAFGRGIGGEQDTNIGIFRIRLKCGFDLLALLLIHAAMNDPETISAIPVRSEDLMKPLMCRAVLGEEDDAAVVPLAVRPQVGPDPLDNRPAFRIRFVTGALSPIAHPGEHPQLFLGRRGTAFRGFLDGFGLRGLYLSVVRIVLFGFQDRLAQDALGHRIRLLLDFAAGQRAEMPLQRRRECRRR